MVLIQCGNESLALTVEQFNEARERARAIMPPVVTPAGSPQADQVLDAGGMEKATGIPATWFLEQARRKMVPHLRAGKYVRFELAKVLEALRAEDGTRSCGPSRTGKQPPTQPVGKRRYPRATTSLAIGTGAPRL